MDILESQVWQHLSADEQIVAEYKQAGWGIYDDTLDLYKAVAYIDCYYGDNILVGDLYKVLGWSPLIEDYDLIF